MDADRESTARLVPYQFAKAQGALLLELGESQAVVCLRAGARAQVLGELQRVLGVPVRVSSVEPAQAFERLLADLSTRANQSAA